IRTQGKEDFSLSIKGLDIGVATAMTEFPVEMEGTFNMDISLKGFADAPVIEGSMEVNKGKINQFEYKSFNGEFEYRKHKLSWLFNLNTGQMKPLILDGYMPLHLSLKEQQEMFSGNTPLNVNLYTEQFPMTFIEVANISTLKTKGHIVCDLKVSGVLDKPRPSGFFRVENSAIEIPEFGINYKDLQLELFADSAEVALKKFRINQENGFLKTDGKVQFDSSLISGKIINMEFGLSAKDFFLVRHSDYQLQLSGSAFLEGDTREPRVGGDIEILRSSFYLPALTGENKAKFKDEQGMPLLVKEKRKMQSVQDTLSQNRLVVKEEKRTDPPNIYKNLRGSMNITIPKNTWIKSPDMRLELGGDFNTVKNGPELEVFGTIRIIRGYYELLGRRFTIKEGELIFQGGKEINPQIILEAEYVFRTPAREKRILLLKVSGKAKTPQLEFFLEEQKISEGDAIAYIMFGRSMDELTAGQQEGLAATGGASTTEDLAVGLAANLISAELTKLVGQKLNLDYIEIKSQDDWQSSSFVVGKYLTNDLFVSYQREFGNSQDDTVPRQIVTMEYELTEFLFLELLGNSKYNGFDVIFKFDSE
ncbi:MAG: hypothetical protein GF313_12400, partial [Caldithrix sp.]|nr:hypothetical protein [Caldithrix sp.]